jgi:hypothetical protein
MAHDILTYVALLSEVDQDLKTNGVCTLNKNPT